MKQKIWLEAAINGAAGRAVQPRIPMTPEEIVDDAVACAQGGAAIIHLHAYDANGVGVEDADIYARIFEDIRARCDAIVYPTLALKGDRDARLAPVRALARRGLMEWGVIDPGSVNITHRMQAMAGLDGVHYPNPDDHIREALRLASADGWRPAYAIYEPGFARLGAALASATPGLRTPVYRVMFSDNLLFGMAPSPRGLDFYAAHLDETAPGAPRMLSGLDADIDALIEPALALGFHIRVGLEDAPFGTDRSNADLVTAAARRIEAAGWRLASPADVRAAP
ncbi:MAG: 3-keto-5-aminohexanoate cleavage protein [Parvularculaceae bacterium]|nr:3-keto-5-aminohexanoate cleavage protein [Parvularculaceae bacterium]